MLSTFIAITHFPQMARMYFNRHLPHTYTHEMIIVGMPHGRKNFSNYFSSSFECSSNTEAEEKLLGNCIFET
jgi:hypothetical protein